MAAFMAVEVTRMYKKVHRLFVNRFKLGECSSLLRRHRPCRERYALTVISQLHTGATISLLDGLHAAKLLVLIGQPLPLSFHELDVINGACQHSRFAGFREACEVARVTLGKRRDDAAKALESGVETLSILALDLVVWYAAADAGLGAGGVDGGVVGGVGFASVDSWPATLSLRLYWSRLHEVIRRVAVYGAIGTCQRGCTGVNAKLAAVAAEGRRG